MIQAYLMFITVLLLVVYKKGNRILKMILDKFIKQNKNKKKQTKQFSLMFF